MTLDGQTATLVGDGTADITASWDAYDVDQSCTLSAEGECIDARCQATQISNPIGHTDVIGKPTITGPTTLWWFNDYPSPDTTHYPIVVSLTASSSTSNSYTYRITSGSDKAGLGPNLGTTYFSSSNTVNLGSRMSSDMEGDVVVTVTVRGISSDPIHITVRRPAYLQFEGVSYFAGPEDQPYGFRTQISYSVWDNLSTRLPTSVPVNEYFTTGIIRDYPGTDWQRSDPNGYSTDSTAKFFDTLGVFQSSLIFGGWTPRPQSPGNPLSSSRIIHFHQQFWVGTLNPGTGVLVQDDTLVLYLDHGAHEDVSNP